MKVETALVSAKTMKRLATKSIREIKANHHAFFIFR